VRLAQERVELSEQSVRKVPVPRRAGVGEGGESGAADGRRQRSATSRRRIVDAMIDLVRAGNLSPSAEAVSRHANVSLRTVFRHFDDMDSLYREMASVIEAEVAPISQAPIPDGPWPLVLDELISRRARVFERIMPFKLAGNMRRHQSSVLQAQQSGLIALQRQVLRELVPAPFHADTSLFEALDLLLCFESWHRLRTDQSLSVPKAQAVLRLACLALTAGHA
jgi:AcrR family transcriptional regulator